MSASAPPAPNQAPTSRLAGGLPANPRPGDREAINLLLKAAYEKAVAAGHSNISSDLAPLPKTLLEPPPRPPTYWVVTSGEKVGISNDPRVFDFSRVHLLPRFAIQRFESWEDAHKFYTQEFEEGNVTVFHYAEYGAPEKPIHILSNLPTPAPPPKKVARFETNNPPKADEPPKPLGAQTRIRRSKATSASAPPTQTVKGGTVNVSSDGAEPDPKVVPRADSEDYDLIYPKARQVAPVTPVRRAKRPFPLLARDRQSPTVEERGSPVSRGPPAKKARATSQPASDSFSEGDLYVSDSYVPPVVQPYFGSRTPLDKVDLILSKIVRGDDPDVQESSKGKGSAKGKGKGKAVDRK